MRTTTITMRLPVLVAEEWRAYRKQMGKAFGAMSNAGHILALMDLMPPTSYAASLLYWDYSRLGYWEALNDPGTHYNMAQTAQHLTNHAAKITDLIPCDEPVTDDLKRLAITSLAVAAKNLSALRMRRNDVEHVNRMYREHLEAEAGIRSKSWNWGWTLEQCRKQDAPLLPQYFDPDGTLAPATAPA